MTAISRSLARGLVLPFFAIFLSSCAMNNNVGLFPDVSQDNRPEFSAQDKDDVELENVESKVCLDEELNALSQTGGLH